MPPTRNLRDLAAVGAAWRHSADGERQRRALRDEAIRAAAAAGHSSRAIAREVGLEDSAVRRILSGSRGAEVREP